MDCLVCGYHYDMKEAINDQLNISPVPVYNKQIMILLIVLFSQRLRHNGHVYLSHLDVYINIDICIIHRI